MSKNSSSPAAPFSTGYKGYCLFQQMEKKLWKAVHMVQKGAQRGRAPGVVNERGWGRLAPSLTQDLSSPWNLLELRHQHANVEPQLSGHAVSISIGFWSLPHHTLETQGFFSCGTQYLRSTQSPRVRGVGRKPSAFPALGGSTPAVDSCHPVLLEPGSRDWSIFGGRAVGKVLALRGPTVSHESKFRFLFPWSWEPLAPTPLGAHGFPWATCHENKK